jgi:hypothetical protein
MPLLMTNQELGSMYDYLAKIILLGPSGCGKYATLAVMDLDRAGTDKLSDRVYCTAS